LFIGDFERLQIPDTGDSGVEGGVGGAKSIRIVLGQALIPVERLVAVQT
jgi:hypothetical protein